MSSESERKSDAVDMLKDREGKVVNGAPITAKIGKLRFEEAANDLLNDYRVNGRRSLRTIEHRVEHRVEHHLKPFFGGRRLSAIGTADIRAYVARRQTAKASNGSINRELTALKRMFNLAVQAGKLVSKPYIPLLKENNVRAGFFEPAQFLSVKNHLPVHMRPIVEFAYTTGWRTPSEILPLEWRQVDMKAGEVRLDAGTTKNGEGRVFPFTAELRRVLEDQLKVAETLKRERETIARQPVAGEIPRRGRGFPP